MNRLQKEFLLRHLLLLFFFFTAWFFFQTVANMSTAFFTALQNLLLFAVFSVLAVTVNLALANPQMFSALAIASNPTKKKKRQEKKKKERGIPVY